MRQQLDLIRPYETIVPNLSLKPERPTKAHFESESGDRYGGVPGIPTHLRAAMIFRASWTVTALPRRAAMSVFPLGDGVEVPFVSR